MVWATIHSPACSNEIVPTRGWEIVRTDARLGQAGECAIDLGSRLAQRRHAGRARGVGGGVQGLRRVDRAQQAGLDVGPGTLDELRRGWPGAGSSSPLTSPATSRLKVATWRRSARGSRPLPRVASPPRGPTRTRAARRGVRWRRKTPASTRSTREARGSVIQARSVAGAQYWSKAAISWRAIRSADWPSICRRSIMNTSWPSCSSATEGELGG